MSDLQSETKSYSFYYHKKEEIQIKFLIQKKTVNSDICSLKKYMWV